MGRTDLAEKALNSAIHGVIKGVKNEELPSDCSVKPYGEDRELPEVCSSISTSSFSVTFSAPISLT